MKVDKKVWIAVIITAIIVAVVTSLITVSVTRNVQYSPRYANVNANSCNADETCEMNYAVVSNRADVFGFLKVGGDLNVNGRSYLEGAMTTLNDVELGKYGNQDPPVLRIYRTYEGNKYLNIFSLAKLDNGLNVNNGDSSFEGRVILPNLAGNTKAYLCVDAQGVVFRNPSPCV